MPRIHPDDQDHTECIHHKHEKVVPPEEAAAQFMDLCGLTPTVDSVNQLVEAFLPALRIMIERGYDPNGDTWIKTGWRGLVWNILGKAGRIRFHSWRNGDFDGDSAIDLINFGGFYYRLGNTGEPWGDWGDPGEVPDRIYRTEGAMSPSPDGWSSPDGEYVKKDGRWVRREEL
jgi:hypothetical protein